MDFKSKIVLIYGPTASGKSIFAIKLAKKIKGEIVNADSMQVYRELKLLTARPLKKNYQKIKHHLYGFQNSKKIFSTGDWLKLANENIVNIKKRKKTPILVGGTGLYFKALTDGLVEIPNIPLKIRNKVRRLQKTIGQVKFYKKLLSIDPLILSKIDSTDSQRSIRAYEIKLFTKKSIVDWFKKTKSNFNNQDFLKIYIDFPRPNLINRINKRTNQMIKLGAINEVIRFNKKKIPKNRSINKAIGVSEIKDFIKKKISKDVLIEKISIKTRQYAKRQSTWARGHMTDWKKVNPRDLSRYLKKN